jgi:ketosteroid isomerase-like protein
MEPKNSTTSKLIAAYYDDLKTGKERWISMLSEEVAFSGPGKSHLGKEAFKVTLNNYLRLVKSLRVKQVTTENENASVIANYDLRSPTGKEFNLDVAEIWEIKDGKLNSLTIYFDTALFKEFMA